MILLEQESFQPKTVNRWMVELPKEFKIESFVIQKTSRPEYYYNLFGQKIYKPIDIYLTDPIGPSSALGVDRMEEMLKPKTFIERLLGIRKTFDYTLKLLDSVGSEVERWSIKKCKIVNVQYGELDYSKNDITKIKLTIQPKDVKLIF